MKVKNLKFCVQRPRRQSFEERRNVAADVWWGATLQPFDRVCEKSYCFPTKVVFSFRNTDKLSK